MSTTTVRLACALLLAAGLAGAAGEARAEPPMMKEQSVRPRIEATSEDGRFSVALGGFVQGRYTLVMQGEEVEASRFGVPRTRLYAFGHVGSPDVRYRLMIGTPPDEPGVELFDAYVEWRAADALRLRGGQFKIPVLREWVESARLLASVERTVLTRAILPGREIGVMASGELRRTNVDYAVAIMNGPEAEGEAWSRVAPIVAGRVVWNAMGRSIEGEVDFEDSPATISLGISGMTRPAWGAAAAAADGGAAIPRDTTAGFEFAYRGRGLDVTMEVMGRRRELGGEAETVAGGYVRADQYVRALRAGFGARVTRIVGLGGRAPEGREPTRTEVELDGAYYPAEHDLKVAGNLGIARIEEARRWEPFVMVQVQAAF